MKFGRLLILAWFIASSKMCQADILQLSGSARAGFWSSSRDLDDDSNLTNGAAWLKVTSRPLDSLRLHAEGYISRQDLFSNRTDNKKDTLREAYIDTSRGAVDIRLGKQIIAWGRADRFNPTDNLTSKDFTLLTVDDDDQRLGTESIKADYHINNSISITVAWLWDFQGNNAPIAALAPGISLIRIPVEDGYRQGAFRIDQSGNAIDWSLSYFSGYDLNPDISLAFTSTPAVSLALSNNRIQVIGFDAATTTGRFGLRAETAYIRTEDSDGRNLFIKNSNWYTVLGAERTFRDTLTINLQYLARVVIDYHSVDEIADANLQNLARTEAVINNQIDRYNHGIALRIGERWLHQTLNTEAACVYTFGQHDYVLRLKIKYALSDNWEAAVGADLFRGLPNTFYGRLKDNSTVFSQLRFNF